MAEVKTPDEIERASGPVDQTLFTRVIDVMAAIGTVWTFALMFLIVGDIAGRAAQYPLKSVAEIAGQSIICIVFLQLASAVNAGRMTRADFLLDLLGGSESSIVRFLEILFSSMGALAMALIAYAAVSPLKDAWVGNEYFGVQGHFTFPTWPTHSLIVLGASMAAIAFLRLAWRAARSLTRR